MYINAEIRKSVSLHRRGFVAFPRKYKHKLALYKVLADVVDLSRIEK